MKTSYQSSCIHFTTQGSGRPLVLLHGFLESSRIWDPFVSEWSQNRQVVCIDLPGHGQSEVVDEIHSMKLFSEVVHFVITELGLEKVDLLGHSMGGYVTLSFLEYFPGMVGKIILLNSSAAPDSEARKQSRERAAALVQKNKSAFVSMAISNTLSPDNYQVFKAYIKSMKNEALRFPREGIIAAINGMKNRTGSIEVLKSFAGEKYFISGIDDPIIPIQEIKQEAVATGALLYELSGGHLSFLEVASEFCEIMQFVD